MNYLASVLIGYLLGSFNAAYFLSKAKGFDIREKGTHNPGASNMTVTLGWSYGIITALLDILKATLAVIVCQRLFPNVEYAGFVGGIASVMGHMYSIFLKFKGGKGFASYMGMLLAIDWKIALVLIVVSALITIITNYIAIATLFTIIAYPIYYYLQNQYTPMLYALIALALIIVYRHHKNIVNIISGKEIGLRSIGKNK
jgi:glycerol-3-phosphate acyltransferase PlsY